MVTINNTDLMNELRDVAKIQAGRDMIPNVMSNQVVPVVNVNPKDYRRNMVASASRGVTGTYSIITLNAGRRFFLTNINIELIKDVLCDVASGVISVTATIDGVSTIIHSIPVLTLTAQSNTIAIQFKNPIAIDIGTTISQTGTYANGTMWRNVSISGYYVDNPNA